MNLSRYGVGGLFRKPGHDNTGGAGSLGMRSEWPKSFSRVVGYGGGGGCAYRRERDTPNRSWLVRWLSREGGRGADNFLF